MTSRSQVLTVREIQALDTTAIERYGIPSLKLMENAGRGTAEEILKLLRKIKRREVAIFCGTGNNGGDGFVVARHLKMKGAAVHVFLIGQPSELKKDAAYNFKLLEHVDVKAVTVGSVTPMMRSAVRNSSVLVDAIFGVGLNRKVGEPFYSVIDFINQTKKKIISVDVPSGLNATSGKIFGICVRADVIVTFSAAKKGFYQGQGKKYTGAVKVIDIGIPKELLKKK